MCPTELICALPGAVILIPVGAGVPEALESGDGKHRDAGIAVQSVGRKIGNAQLRPRIGEIVDREII